MKLIEVVEELNQELFDKKKETNHQFYFMTNGYIDYILFDREVIWNSEDDGREFREETNDYEPMLPFIKKQFKIYAKEVNNLKL